MALVDQFALNGAAWTLDVDVKLPVPQPVVATEQS